MNMTCYTVNVDRDDTMWRVRVPAISRSVAAADLAEVDSMARDLIWLVTDQRPETFELNVNVEES